MPKSTSYLPDLNVWLALASKRHAHSAICAAWLDSLSASSISFCRVTQLGLLRLLTNTAVMGGDVLSSRAAWRVFASMLADERIQFAPEPVGLDSHLQRLTNFDVPAPKVWNDAYLSAFARAGSMRLVTLDRAMLPLDPSALLLG